MDHLRGEIFDYAGIDDNICTTKQILSLEREFVFGRGNRSNYTKMGDDP